MVKLIKFTVVTFFIILIANSACFAFDIDKKEGAPVIVNGDKVEYFAELEKVVAEGNVVIEYSDVTLTCDRIVVFTKTKDGFAEGNVKLKDQKGIIKGDSLFYNFDSKDYPINRLLYLF